MSKSLSDIAGYRLNNQQISVHQFSRPAEIVAWLGALQAQDYAGAKWSIGLRLPAATDSGIEEAICNRSIIRTWSLRGTLHFVAAHDLHWILKLLAPRLSNINGSQYRKLGLDKRLLVRSQKLLMGALKGGKQLTRKELKVVLEKGRIPNHDMRTSFILLRAALDGLICLGPKRDKEFTYLLLDEWVPSGKEKQHEESLSELAKRYFQSHGPATLQDFIWWSGLSGKDARFAIESCRPYLKQIVLQGQAYWMNETGNLPATNLNATHLLPGFDEYMLGYTNRSEVLKTTDARKVMGSGNGILSSTIVINGMLAGTWRRTFKRNKVLIETKPFLPLGKSGKLALAIAAGRFCEYLGMKQQ